MTQIEKIRKKYEIDLHSFDVAKEDYYQDCFVREIEPSTFLRELEELKTSEKANNSFNTFCGKLSEIANISADEAKVKEGANIYWSNIEGMIPCIGFVTEESKFDITIGLFRDFYITTKLRYTDNICFMKDDFWQMLLELSSLGKFEFREEHKPSSEIRKKHPQLFNKRGNIYKLMRNYFLNQTEYGFCNSLGYLSVKWDNSTPFKDLILNYCEAFKIMYNLNYMLWAAESKKNKR